MIQIKTIILYVSIILFIVYSPQIAHTLPYTDANLNDKLNVLILDFIREDVIIYFYDAEINLRENKNDLSLNNFNVGDGQYINEIEFYYGHDTRDMYSMLGISFAKNTPFFTDSSKWLTIIINQNNYVDIYNLLGISYHGPISLDIRVPELYATGHALTPYFHNYDDFFFSPSASYPFEIDPTSEALSRLEPAIRRSSADGPDSFWDPEYSTRKRSPLLFLLSYMLLLLFTIILVKRSKSS